MTAKLVATVCNGIAVVAAYIAAWLWYKSTVVYVDEVAGGTGNPEIIVDGRPFIATAREQAKWSKRAARAAAVAAFFQGCGLVADHT